MAFGFALLSSVQGSCQHRLFIRFSVRPWMCCSTCLAWGESGSVVLSVPLQIHNLCHNLSEGRSHAHSKISVSHLLFCCLCILAAKLCILFSKQRHISRNTQSTLETNPRTGNFFSKLVIVALSHQGWKSIALAGRTCCSVEQWNDSGEWVALGPALKGPVSRISFQRAMVQVQGFPCHQGTGVRNQLPCFTFFWF